jgi:integrase
LSLPPGSVDQVFFDDTLPGFGLRLRAGGSRTWHLQYAIAGKTRRMTLGSVGVLDPGKARSTARDLLAQVRLGRDPATEKVHARAKAAETFGALLPHFLERQRARLKPRSFEETNRHLTSHAKPLHGRAVEAIDRRAVAIRIAEIEKTSGPAAANRVRASLSGFFTWLAKEGFVDSNPVAFTNKAVEGAGRERVLADDELATIWRALGEDQYSSIIKLLVLTGLRRTEVGDLRWSEIDFDDAIVALPPARTKNRREHVVPLSEPALAILKAQPRRTEADGTPRDYVFGNGADRGWQDWSGSLEDLNARIKAREGRALAEWRPHDFRRSLSTALHERFNVQPHVVEAALGHTVKGVASLYNKALYLDERRRALERWGEHITALVTGKSPQVKVVRLTR